ncbi:MAG: TIR domain-containing protein [Thiomargarita sp.]|nr:TIR domain-containing protein [Thiomargarita sp.]
MVYVPDYKHDIFVSYAHVDNESLIPGRTGWVTTLVNGLKKELAKQLGREDAFSLWMDHGLRGNEAVTPDIDNQLKNSATFIFFATRGYFASHWCRLEFHSFLKQVGEGSGRLFMVVTKPLDAEQKLPEIEELAGYDFWKKDSNGIARTLAEPIPNPETEPEYYIKLSDMAAQLADKLNHLRNEATTEDNGVKLSRLKTAKKARLEAEKISLDTTLNGLLKQHDSISKSLTLRLPAENRNDLKNQLHKLEDQAEDLELQIEVIDSELKRLLG